MGLFSKENIEKLIEEIISNGAGWIAGIVSIDLLDLFFIQKSWKNAWGIFSKKTVVDAQTYSFLEWATTALIGFIVMLLVNRIVRNKFLAKILKKNKTEPDEPGDLLA